MNLVELVEKVKEWSNNRGLSTKDPRLQLVKLMEELGELSAGVLKNKGDIIIDSIGDVMVVIIILCQQLGLELETCLEFAYNEIKDRKGEMKNGIFVKEQDL